MAFWIGAGDNLREIKPAKEKCQAFGWAKSPVLMTAVTSKRMIWSTSFGQFGGPFSKGMIATYSQRASR